MEIGLGVFTGEALDPGAVSQHQEIHDALGQMTLADEVGLDAVWISEHHFLPNGYVGSVLPFAAAAAMATRRLTVGISVALAPLYDPVRLAEDTAFLDQLSGGRAALGVAIGYRDAEYEGFGTSRKARVGRTEELCELLRQSWGDGPLDFTGRHFQRSGVEVFPKPLQPGGVPLLMGGHAPGAIDRVARLADAFIMDGGTDSAVFGAAGHNRDLYDRVASAVELYKEALRRNGKDDRNPRMYLTLGGLLHADGADAAWDALAEGYMYTRRVYGDWYGLDPADYADWYPARMEAAEHARRRTEVVLGTPDDVTPVMDRLREIVGDGLHVMFRSKYPGVDVTTTRNSIELLGEVRSRVGTPLAASAVGS